MQELQPGQNHPLGGGRIAVGVSGEPSDEFAAKTQLGAALLNSAGRVRDADDLISAEQPRSRDGSVTFTGFPGELRIDLDAVPEVIARIAVVLTVKPGFAPATTFGVFSAVRAWLADPSGKLPLLFSLPPASRGETALIMAELYRHQGQWKFRAVGQGFSAGYTCQNRTQKHRR